MKKVILIGDSIRMAYQDTVKRELQTLAQVIGPEGNGGTSENVLNHLQAWVIDYDPDVVHINAGLHDLATGYADGSSPEPFKPGRPRVSHEQYAANVRQILETLRQRTRAQIIWALITPVDEKRHHEAKGFDRLEKDVRAYNDAAARFAAGMEVPINDLHTAALDAGADRMLTDGVHFTAEGSELLGKAVASMIRRYL